MSKERISSISFLKKSRRNFIDYSAAVIIPIVRKSDGVKIVFTKRSKCLNQHAGEISFPGGKIEKGETPLEAAVREIKEEISARVEHVISSLDPVYTFVSSHYVLPYAAVVKNEPFHLNGEVESVLFLDLEELKSYTPKYEVLEYGSLKLRSYAWDFGGFYVWGVTGRILFSFKKKLTDSQFKNIVYNKMG